MPLGPYDVKANLKPEPACGIRNSTISAELNNWEKVEFWHIGTNDIEVLIQAKNSLYWLGTSSKPQLKVLTGRLTGHGKLNFTISRRSD